MSSLHAAVCRSYGGDGSALISAASGHLPGAEAALDGQGRPRPPLQPPASSTICDHSSAPPPSSSAPTEYGEHLLPIPPLPRLV
jgi:hypothetical protein